MLLVGIYFISPSPQWLQPNPKAWWIQSIYDKIPWPLLSKDMLFPFIFSVLVNSLEDRMAADRWDISGIH